MVVWSHPFLPLLQSMFRSDFIRYTMIPCGDLSDIHQARDDLIESPGDVRIMLGSRLGALLVCKLIGVIAV